MSFRHIILVARLELIKRVRSTRWLVALGVWAVVLLLITAVFVITSDWFTVDNGDPKQIELANATIASLLVYFVLIIGMIVAGGNAAGSINGDRTNATLALLQVSPVSGVSIVLGKLIAAWMASLALLAVATPFLVFFMFRAPWAAPWLLLGMLVTAMILLAAAGIGMGLSTLTPRPAGSTAMTFLVIIALLLGGPVIGAVLDQYTSERFEVKQNILVTKYDEDGVPAENDQQVCEQITTQIYVRHTQHYWWILLSNPVIVLADSLPYSIDSEVTPEYSSPLSHVYPNAAFVNATAYLSTPGSASPVRNLCGVGDKYAFAGVGDPDAESELIRQQVGTLWPRGLVFFLLLGASFTVIAIRRTGVPVDRLPRGVRIA